MQKKKILLVKKLKNTESAQFCLVDCMKFQTTYLQETADTTAYKKLQTTYLKWLNYGSIM